MPSAATVAAGPVPIPSGKRADRAHGEKDEADVGRIGGQVEAGEDDPGADHGHRGEAGDDQRQPVAQVGIGDHPEPGGEAPVAEAPVGEAQAGQDRERARQHRPGRPARDRPDRGRGDGGEQRRGDDLEHHDRRVGERDLGGRRPARSAVAPEQRHPGR